ncbi:hypothetical protein EJV47_23635 [Hymenobacter gummosus]|uniref:TonB-dependent receptor plug domain-containing protein n=1 Tax=Hymenobacter gummosus TaxID=1776032 RepID=A0A431TWT6_9BACT|nr:TonB-dependent receptor plug domain-containing protein [Hymenobacter gummosus]RTQ45827.1 hypothetical protein EJV47_23635 [Hymenobacter gummosus]
MHARLLAGALIVLPAPMAWAQQPAPAAVSAPDSLTLPPLEGAHDGAGTVRVADLPLLPVQERLRQVAGVQVTPYSGAPGSPAVVRIRGAGSVANGNTRPLYVVDGIPVFTASVADPSETSPIFSLSAETNANPLLTLPPQTIESVEVLKGALATARYGLYGQNGVVLIRTRLGAEGQPLRVRYQGFGTVSQPLRRFELLTARQYAELANEAAANNNRPPAYPAAELARLGTDWQNEVLRPAALGQQQHLSVSGGSARGTSYYAAADYLGQQGVVRYAFLRRYGLRLNVAQTIGTRLRVEGRVGFSQSDERRPSSAVVPAALTNLPTLPVRDANGQYVPIRIFSSLRMPNAAQLVAESYRRPREQRLLAQVGAYYQLLPGLSAELRGSLERHELTARQYTSSFYIPNAATPAVPTLHQRHSYQQWILYPALRFARTWREQHTLTAALEGQQWISRQRQSVEEDYGGMGQQRSSDYLRLNQHNDLLTAGYRYADRYELQASLRAERITPLFSDSYWWWLPGAQFTWHAAREGFLSGSARLSTLDVWAGWGRTGTGSADGMRIVQGNVAYQRPANRTTQQEVGLQLGLWQNALTITATAYRRYTEGNLSLLLSGLPSGMPASVAVLSHQIRNRGAELTLQGHWQLGRLQGVSRLAAAYNANRYTDNFGFGGTFGQTRAASGQPLSAFYGFRYQNGVDPGTGQYRYADLNGDGRLTFDDQQALGTAIPPQLLSLGQQARAGRWALSLQLDGMFGYQVHNALLASLDYAADGSNRSTRVLDRWTPTNLDSDVVKAGGASGNFGDYQLQPGTNVRLSAAQLSFSVWRRGPRQADIWLAGHNLLVLTRYRGFDPNVSSAGADPSQAGIDNNAYPVARTVALGVSATL